MSTYISPEMQAGLDAARKKALKRRHRLRVEVDGQSFRVLRFGDTGFTLDIDNAPKLRGLVDLFDGSKHLYQCLIVATQEQGGEMRYEFKRATLAAERAPVDFFKGENAPVALLNYDG